MTQISATLKRKTGDDTYTDVRTVGCLLKIKTDENGKYILETDEPLSLGDLGNLSITPTENEGVTTYSIKSRYYKTIDNK
ncbi:MAG: hypothetical protein J6R59_01300 [Paludibacteraceae bacterium]|nr:hypothetical protein [Paludibacteraceae bacterium]